VVLQSGGAAEVRLTPAPVPAGVRLPASLPRMSSLGDTLHLQAVVVFATGDTIPGLEVGWSTPDTAVVAVTPQGRVIARAEGEARLVATHAAASATATLHVQAEVATVQIEPGTATLQVGETLQLTATARDRRGNVLTRTVEAWTSSNPAAVAVDGSGRVTALGFGSATITARVASQSGSASISVGNGVRYAAVASGLSHSCGIDAAGRAFCWGSNSDGQLGSPSVAERSTTPVAVATGLRFRTITAGMAHSCGVAEDNRAYCWGFNGNGELGNRANQQGAQRSSTPIPVDGNLSFQSVVAGTYHTCGIAGDGRAYCWGANHIGQLGNAEHYRSSAEDFSSSPLPVDGDLRFQALDASGDWFIHWWEQHTCGITTDGRAFCWGDNEAGQLGNAANARGAKMSPSPVAVDGSLRFHSIGLGFAHTCGVAADGRLHCWGSNGDGQLGIGTVGGSQFSPVAVAGGGSFRSVSGGDYFTCALATDGRAQCWGINQYGELGDGTTTRRTTPVAVSGGRSFQQMSAGFLHVCATTGSEAFCWGWNETGQLGNGTHANSSVPARVVEPGSAAAPATLRAAASVAVSPGLEQVGRSRATSRPAKDPPDAAGSRPNSPRLLRQ
jgi:alpha-tubulin suppressor-like RCC1 family protein